MTDARMSKLDKSLRVVSFGDSAILIERKSENFSLEIVKQMQALAHTFQECGDWEEVVTAYNSVLVKFNPAKRTFAQAKQSVERAMMNPLSKKAVQGSLIEVPVCYGGDFGPDMANIEKSSGLTASEIIALHSGQNYLVCMMGFIPGFGFLSEVPSALHHVRHATPRLKVPAGSVGIAGWQTGIYGLESPGGWQIIGRTPKKIFDPERDAPFFIKAGDTVRFVAKSQEIFL